MLAAYHAPSRPHRLLAAQTLLRRSLCASAGDQQQNGAAAQEEAGSTDAAKKKKKKSSGAAESSVLCPSGRCLGRRATAFFLPVSFNAGMPAPGLCLQARRPSSKQTPPAFRCHSCTPMATSQRGSGSPTRRSEWLSAHSWDASPAWRDAKCRTMAGTA